MHKVLHVIATDARRGAESAARQLDEGLRERGWTSHVVAVSRSAAGGAGEQVLGRHWADPLGLKTFRRLARQADVVVAHGSTTLWTAGLGLLGHATPFVYVNIGDPHFWANTPARRARVRWLQSRAASVAAVAEGSADVLMTDFGISPARIEVIRNGRSPERFRPATAGERERARSSFNLKGDGPVVAFIGSLSPEKRPELAVAAVAQIDGARLLVAGDGPLRHQLGPPAEILGSVPDPERVLAAADVVLLTSASEGVPGVLVEAALCGLPSVASDVGYVAEIVRDGCTGRLVRSDEPAAYAEALRESFANRTEWGGRARELACTTYSSHTVFDQWAKLLTKVVANH